MFISKINLDNDLDSRNGLGLIIKILPYDPEQKQKHMGFFHLLPTCTIAHLGWFNAYYYEMGIDKIKSYATLWMEFIPPRRALPIINQLRLLAVDNNGKQQEGCIEKDINYGIVFNNETEIIDREIVHKSFGESLTCATFVLSILGGFGYNLIDRSTWEINEFDIEWQKQIINMLENPDFHISAKYLDFQKDHVGKVPRFRPEQVVAAASVFNGVPISFSKATELGIEVNNQLKKLFT